MKVFVANTTRQIQDFNWRMVGSNALHRMQIDVGQQVQLPGTWQPEDIDYLQKQHRPYGLVEVGEIDRRKDFIGLCYSINRAIPVEKIRRALVTNQDVLEERGRTLRQHAAVAAAQQAMQAHPDARLTALEMTIQEERDDGVTPAVNEGIRVPTAGQGGPPPPPPATTRRRRAA